MLMSVQLTACGYMNASARGGQCSAAPGAGAPGGCELPYIVLETKLTSSEKALGAFNS